jgi:hypothetical protein
MLPEMSSEKPLVYLVLGASGSGRRAIVADLIQGGLEATDRVAVMLPAGEAETAGDATLPAVSRWQWDDGMIVGTLPRDAAHVFFVTDGARNPIDQIEVFKAWVEAQHGELARILCVVNCQFASRHPALRAWYDACVHFSDVVLLNRREGVPNKWLSEFQSHYKHLFVPCLFEFVKDGIVKNPALVLEPQARRMSHAFDAEQDWIFTDGEGDVIDEQEESETDEDDVEAKPEEEPYFERLNGGRRVKELPDIAKYLALDASAGSAP